MTSVRHLALALAIVLVIGAGVRGAHAWSPIDSSRPVWGGTAPYALQTPGSADLGIDSTEAEVRRGMDDWTLVACTSLRTMYNGRVSTVAGRGDGQSVIGWVESGWDYGSGTIGVTGPRWSRNIVEADMEMNGQNYTWITGSGRGSSVNAYSIILHEGGHYYGLGHSSSSSATMFASYGGGISSLSTDDQNGICALYPGGSSDCTTTGCPTGQECVSGTCVTMMGDGGVCSPCASGGDCTDGVCLRYPDGAGYCGASCSSSSECGGDSCVNITGIGGQCVRLEGGSPSCAGGGPTGCTSDSDCGPTERCNGAGDCEPRPMTGGDIGYSCGASSECNSGVCFTGTCTQSCDWLSPASSCPAGYLCSGEVTGACSGSGLCIPGGAGGAPLGTVCGAATDCASAYCAAGVCSTPCIPGGAAGCPDGFACQVGAVAGCGSCQQSGGLGDPCMVNEDCTSMICATVEGESFCTGYCDAATPCASGFACVDAGGGVSVCVPESGGLGSECGDNTECLSGICADEGSRSYCTRLCDPRSTPCPGGFDCIATDDPSVRVCRPPSSGGGCGCSTPGMGAGTGARGALLALLALGIVLHRRRRR